MSPRLSPAVLVLSLLIFAAGAHAQSKPAPPCPALQAMRLTGSVNVDGVLDEAVWSQGDPVTAFYQRDPNQGEPARFRTEARIAYDDDAIYVAAHMVDPQPDSIVARLSRRDESIPADRFCIYLDPFHDKRSGYYFMINAAGTKFDGTMANDGYEDNSWDGVWEARQKRTADGWTAEFRIPLSQMRFQNAPHQVWGVNLRRVIPRYSEEDMLAYPPRDESGFVSRFPELAGLESLHSGGGVELLPYVTTKASYTQHDSGDPFNDGSSYQPNVGGDLRMPVGSRLTLNGTVNPDFGQVEVDPASVNLTDVETFYQEKRPFFVEGSQIFRFGNEGASDYWNFNWPEPIFFYSRRIGRAPQGSVPDSASYADVPNGTRILGAAKLTGKVSPTVNFGLMQALTGRERADYVTAGGYQGTSDVEPLTYYGVLRTQKEFHERRHGLGLMANLVQRSFTDDVLPDQLSRTASMAGLDGWTFLDAKKVWVLSGYSTFSYVGGTATQIATMQQNARHYYQRPDADHVEFDPTATSMTGGATRLWLNKEKGRWFSNSAIGAMTPGFEANDVGFQPYADVINAHTVLGYKWTEPGKIKRFTRLDFATFASQDFGGHLTSAGLFHFGYTQFQNLHEINWSIGGSPDFTSVRRTRGGPRMTRPAGYESNFGYNTDLQKKLAVILSVGLSAQPSTPTQNWSVNPEVDWKPASNVQISVAPGFEHNIDDAQYVDQYDNPAATETYGRSYVFAHLDQSTAYASVRMSLAFSPTMTLQVFAQPFISTGMYTDYKALARPGTYEFVPATPENADFNYRSLRGNSVFRWEYMPGSALYVAWTQQRQATESNGEFHLGTSVSELASTPPDNIFLVKLTYYLHL